ncbi:MAG: hypothetical protein WKF63_02710 [Thermomicrobiales bacterium]
MTVRPVGSVTALAGFLKDHVYPDWFLLAPWRLHDQAATGHEFTALNGAVVVETS